MQKENTIMTMNRRSFLAGGLAGTAAALSGATHATPILAPKKWDATHDVVIVGAGAAGLTAACEAVDRKLSAVVFEKMPIMGGSSVLCGGMIAVSDTDEQKAQNIKDSHDLFVKDLIVSGGGYADEKVVRAYVSAIREHYEWLTKKLGLKPDAIVLQGGQSVALAPFQPEQDPHGDGRLRKEGRRRHPHEVRGRTPHLVVGHEENRGRSRKDG